MSKYQDETLSERWERQADNAELRAKWLAGFAMAFTFGPAQFVIMGVYLLFGWTFPQMTTLEILAFFWIGPSVLLWWGANYQEKQAAWHREYAKGSRDRERKERLEALSKPAGQDTVTAEPKPEPKVPSAREVMQQGIRDSLRVKN